MVLAPEHPLVAELTAPDRKAEVEAYVAQAAIRTEIDRLSTDREKTGVALGADAINPVNGERIPIFVADYVLGGYGTGAIMAVPAHDERDYAFAVEVRPADPAGRRGARRGGRRRTDGRGVHRPRRRRACSSTAAPYTGLPADEGGTAIVGELEARGKGRAAVTYRLRDWLISRQRYWGTPIPVIYCERDGIVPVPEEDLPGPPAGHRRLPRQRREPAHPRRGVPERDVPGLRRPREARDRHDGHVHRLVLVLVSLPVTGEGRRRRSIAPSSTRGRRSTSTRAAPSTRSCTCCTPASGRR